MSEGGNIFRILQCLLQRGVEEFCLCSGSRNAPIIEALAQNKTIRLFSFFEERSAAFFALGRVAKTQKPVCVVTTSGTAVGELFPAVIEAYYQGLPLIVLTADRPKHFRGSGAPQAIEQVNIFGNYVEECIDVSERIFHEEKLHSWKKISPLHINLCLEEGYVETSSTLLKKKGGGQRKILSPFPSEAPKKLGQFLDGAREKFIVLLGALPQEYRSAVRNFLRHLQAPILAEPTSGLCEEKTLNPYLLRSGENLLNGEEIKFVLRIGGVPCFRFWRDLEKLLEINVCSLSLTKFAGLARKSEMITGDITAAVKGFSPSPKQDEEILLKDRKRKDQLKKLLKKFPLSEVALLEKIYEQIPCSSSVFLGNSLPIREWGLLIGEAGDKQLDYYANRGANGIDGALSTFFGISEGNQESWAIVGDLTALYDLSAPWIQEQLHHGKRTLVIINNQGGKIFSRLANWSHFSPKTRRVLEIPHQRRFASWAAMWGAHYHLVDTPPIPPIDREFTVVEVKPDSAQSEAFWQGYQQLHSP